MARAVSRRQRTIVQGRRSPLGEPHLSLHRGSDCRSPIDVPLGALQWHAQLRSLVPQGGHLGPYMAVLLDQLRNWLRVAAPVWIGRPSWRPVLALARCAGGSLLQTPICLNLLIANPTPKVWQNITGNICALGGIDTSWASGE
jgi:hypothetical protein